MTPDLSDLLKGLLKRQGVGIREAARQVGMDHAYLVRVTKGTLALPSKHIEPMADLLGLDGAERVAFILSASLRLSPEVVRAHVRNLEQSQAI